MDDNQFKAKLDELIKNSKQRVGETKRKLISELMKTGMLTLEDIPADYFDDLWKEFRESIQDLASLEAARAFIDE